MGIDQIIVIVLPYIFVGGLAITAGITWGLLIRHQQMLAAITELQKLNERLAKLEVEVTRLERQFPRMFIARNPPEV